MPDTTPSDFVPVEAETGILSLIVHHPETHDRIFLALDTDDFYSMRFQRFFDTAHALWKADRPVDPIVIFNDLRARGDKDATDLIADFDTWFGSPGAVESYISLVIDASEDRKILAAAQKLQAGYFDRDTKTADLLEIMHTRTQGYAERKISVQSWMIPEALNEMLDAMDRAAEGEQPGLKTGFADLDAKAELVEGLNILAGRPSMGKTTLALNMAYQIAKDGAYVLIVPLESTEREVCQTLTAAVSGVPGKSIRRGMTTDSQTARIAKAVGEISTLNIEIFPAESLDEICARARIRAKQHKKFILIVDYLQLVTAGMKKDAREQEVSHISRTFKKLGTRMKFPILALAQLNRGVETRSDPRPKLSDLRESGAIEQDADVVMMLYREDYYDDDKPTGKTEINITKQRNGPTGKAELAFFMDISRFASLSKREDPADGS